MYAPWNASEAGESESEGTRTKPVPAPVAEPIVPLLPSDLYAALRAAWAAAQAGTLVNIDEATRQTLFDDEPFSGCFRSPLTMTHRKTGEYAHAPLVGHILIAIGTPSGAPVLKQVMLCVGAVRIPMPDIRPGAWQLALGGGNVLPMPQYHDVRYRCPADTDGTVTTVDGLFMKLNRRWMKALNDSPVRIGASEAGAPGWQVAGGLFSAVEPEAAAAASGLTLEPSLFTH
jgi:hypothetical protein